MFNKLRIVKRTKEPFPVMYVLQTRETIFSSWVDAVFCRSYAEAVIAADKMQKKDAAYGKDKVVWP